MPNTFATKEQMAEVPGLYEAIAPQFRDRIPADVAAAPQNAEVIRKGFGSVPGIVERLFKRLAYRDGHAWPMWKLVGAFALIEAELGAPVVRNVGMKIFSTMPWPKAVTHVADALEFFDSAYRASHGNPKHNLIGGWPIEWKEPGRIIVLNTTPYSFSFEDGTITGVCQAFSHQGAKVELLDPEKSKREGGTVSRYLVTYRP